MSGRSTTHSIFSTRYAAIMYTGLMVLLLIVIALRLVAAPGLEDENGEAKPASVSEFMSALEGGRVNSVRFDRTRYRVAWTGETHGIRRTDVSKGIAGELEQLLRDQKVDYVITKVPRDGALDPWNAVLLAGVGLVFAVSAAVTLDTLFLAIAERDWNEGLWAIVMLLVPVFGAWLYLFMHGRELGKVFMVTAIVLSLLFMSGPIYLTLLREPLPEPVIQEEPV